MVSIDNARIATCIAAAALAGASAVAFPSVARADEGSDPAATLPLPDVPAAPVVEAGSTTGGEEADALGDVITAALDSAGVVDGAPAASPSPTPEPVAEASVPAPATSADPASTTGSASEQPTSQSPDTKGSSVDTTGDTASAAGSTSPRRRRLAPRRRPDGAEQPERQRPHRQPGRQWRGHAGEHRHGSRHRCKQPGSALVRDARSDAGIGTQLSVRRREPPRNGDIVAGLRDELRRRSRDRHVGLAMGLPVCAAAHGDITE